MPPAACRCRIFWRYRWSGSPQTVAFKLQQLRQRYVCDELMFTNDIYDREKRLRALELLPQVQALMANE